MFWSVGSIIMTVDKTGQYLVTGDVDGLVKTWDIKEYCTQTEEDIINTPPRKYPHHSTNTIHVIIEHIWHMGPLIEFV